MSDYIKNSVELDTHRTLIDLDGPQGNAFFLLGIARRAATEMEGAAYAGKVCEKMMAGDYANLLKVFLEEFGEVYTLYASPETLERLGNQGVPVTPLIAGRRNQ